MNVFLNQLFPIQRSHLARTPILYICRTFVWVWDLSCSQWIVNCSGISFPWLLLIPLLQPCTFTKSWNVFVHSPSHLKFFCFFRTCSFTRFKNDLDSTDKSKSALSFPMTKCCSRALSWESTSGRPDLSRSVSSFPTDCRVPSRQICSWEKPSRTFRIMLQEIESSRPDLWYVSKSVFHSSEDQARSSSHFE